MPNARAGGGAVPEPETNGTLCFGGCAHGLKEQAVSVAWSRTAKDRFTMQLRVPKTAWMASDGPHPLANGTYRIGIQCVGVQIRGCGLAPSEASTTLRLTAIGRQHCTTKSCGRIVLSSGTVSPGQEVRFHGWAPLSEIIGSPFPYSIVLVPGKLYSSALIAPHSPYPQIGQVQQNFDGTFRGSLRLPAALPGAVQVTSGTYTLALQGFFSQPSFTAVTFAPVQIRVRPAEPWSALGALRPLRATWSADLSGATPVADPADRSHLAYCQNGVIHFSPNAGHTWSVVPVAGAVELSATTNYHLTPSPNAPSQVSCASVMLEPGHPDTLYASFWASNPKFGMPPVFQVGYVTTDLGQTWHAVSVPEGYSAGGFAGFQTAGMDVLAIFERQAGSSGHWQYTIEATPDGVTDWQQATFACPPIGPCLRFGPSPSQIGGMGAAYPQPVEWSGDGGKTWTSPIWPAQVLLNQGPSEMVALSSSEALLVSGSSQYAVRLTTDGGKTWRYIALPPTPGGQNGAMSLTDAMILPSGALLAQDPNNQSWIMLAPEAKRWCAVSALPSAVFSQPTAIGNHLWYIPMASGNPQTPASIPLQDMVCGQ